MEEKSNFTLLAIVAIVAIVGLVVMMKPSGSAMMGSGIAAQSGNLGGQATGDCTSSKGSDGSFSWDCNGNSGTCHTNGVCDICQDDKCAKVNYKTGEILERLE